MIKRKQHNPSLIYMLRGQFYDQIAISDNWFNLDFSTGKSYSDPLDKTIVFKLQYMWYTKKRLNFN